LPLYSSFCTLHPTGLYCVPPDDVNSNLDECVAHCRKNLGDDLVGATLSAAGFEHSCCWLVMIDSTSTQHIYKCFVVTREITVYLCICND
jgi:hypothetical protein